MSHKKSIVIFVLFITSIVFAILFFTKNCKSMYIKEVNNDLASLLLAQTPGANPNAINCVVNKISSSTGDDPLKIASMIGSGCESFINDAIKTNDYSKVPQVCIKYEGGISKNIMSITHQCFANL
jgi:hypothetical protein